MRTKVSKETNVQLTTSLCNTGLTVRVSRVGGSGLTNRTVEIYCENKRILLAADDFDRLLRGYEAAIEEGCFYLPTDCEDCERGMHGAD